MLDNAVFTNTTFWGRRPTIKAQTLIAGIPSRNHNYLVFNLLFDPRKLNDLEDKELVKSQIKIWTLDNTYKLMEEINKVELNILDDFKANNHKVSSTLIRDFLAKNDFVAASKLLGRPYAISGNVIKGKSLGKRLSTPTANIDIDNVEFCFNGVFLGQIDKDNKSFFCIINFGPKPTFDDYRQSLEAHILDFDKNIYDQALSIKFLCKIRDQVKFNSVEELKNQINDDKNNARELLKSYE